MFNWLSKLRFWKQKAKPIIIAVPEEPVIIIYDEVSEEQDQIIREWEELINFNDYFKNEHAEYLVNLFKQRLKEKYKFTYFMSGGTSNVYLDPRKKYVVKLAQVMGQPAPYDCYPRLQTSVDIPPEWDNPDDIRNYMEIRRIYREHVCCPHKIAKNNLLCIQKYFPQDNYSKDKIINYFMGLLGNHQIHGWRRATRLSDIGVINNMVWDEENNKAWIIDIH